MDATSAIEQPKQAQQHVEMHNPTIRQQSSQRKLQDVIYDVAPCPLLVMGQLGSWADRPVGDHRCQFALLHPAVRSSTGFEFSTTKPLLRQHSNAHSAPHSSFPFGASLVSCRSSLTCCQGPAVPSLARCVVVCWADLADLHSDRRLLARLCSRKLVMPPA